jgi:hypothetical protein
VLTSSRLIFLPLLVHPTMSLFYEDFLRLSPQYIQLYIVVPYFKHFYQYIVEALKLHSNKQSHWSSGQPFASCLGGQRFVSQGCTHSYWVLLLAMSGYIGDPEVIPDHQL